MREPAWEALDHTSDLRFLIRGHSEEDLFANALEAVLAQIVEPQFVCVKERRVISLTSETPLERFLDWLRELLYVVITQGFLVSRAERITLSNDETGYRLDAVLEGEMIDLKRHKLMHEVKTVTYQELSFGLKAGFWEARVVFDV